MYTTRFLANCKNSHSFIVFFTVILFTSPAFGSSAEGVFSTLWGDPLETSAEKKTRYYMTEDDNSIQELDIDENLAMDSGGLLRLNGKRVLVTFQESQLDKNNSPYQKKGLPVRSIELAEPSYKSLQPDSGLAATGNQPWISIMCKFSDVGDEPQNLAYFSNMYSSSYPGLDHYWRQASYNRVDVSGSNASGWYTLPYPESYYNPTDTQGGADLNLLFDDCIGVADSSVDFSSYAGINMMFNTNFDNGYAWGGSRYTTLDGVTKSWRVTWEPPWGYGSITVIAHEMGHGFGMPHSSGTYGATYDNAWDVMSDAWANCGLSTHSTYGCLGQQTIGYQRNLVGWLNSNEIFTYSGSTQTVTLERLTLPSSNNYRLIIIPVDGTRHYFTVEARMRIGYDIKLSSDAVIIHEVKTSRSRPANVIDIDGNGNTDDEGAIWSVGETYTNSAHNICVEVVGKSASSYSVRVGCAPSSPSGTGIIPVYELLLD